MRQAIAKLMKRVGGVDASVPFIPNGWAPTHKHRKGGLYRVITEGINESDRTPVVVYEDQEGIVWVRPRDQFYDGRFETIP